MSSGTSHYQAALPTQALWAAVERAVESLVAAGGMGVPRVAKAREVASGVVRVVPEVAVVMVACSLLCSRSYNVHYK